MTRLVRNTSLSLLSNQDNGQSASLSFGPAAGASGLGAVFGTAGDLNYRTGRYDKDFASLTIKTDPDDAQKVIDAIRSLKHGVAPEYAAIGTNCTTLIEDVLTDLDLNFGDQTPGAYWNDLYRIYSNEASWPWWYFPGYTNAPAQLGKEYGMPRDYGMSYTALIELLYPYQNDPVPDGSVTTTEVDHLPPTPPTAPK